MKTRLQVVGDPVGHSLSPDIHDLFATQLGDLVSYGSETLPVGQFKVRADAFRQAGGTGMNVTVPHKAVAFAYVDLPSVDARAAKAVNTIHFCADGVCRAGAHDSPTRQLLPRKVCWRAPELAKGGTAEPLVELTVGSQKLLPKLLQLNSLDFTNTVNGDQCMLTQMVQC